MEKWLQVQLSPALALSRPSPQVQHNSERFDPNSLGDPNALGGLVPGVEQNEQHISHKQMQMM